MANTAFKNPHHKDVRVGDSSMILRAKFLNFSYEFNKTCLVNKKTSKSIIFSPILEKRKNMNVQ